MKTLNKQLEELETKIVKHNEVNEEVSKSTVGWQIEHILLTINLIIQEIEKSNPIAYKSSFKLSKIIVFTLKKIPRGKARAPKAVTPKEYNAQTLKEHLQNTISKIKSLETIDANKYFDHPYFGNIKVNKAIKFLEIHTNHHLKIINDIIKPNT